jgi:TonB family protein
MTAAPKLSTKAAPRISWRRRTVPLNLQLLASDRKHDARGFTRGSIISLLIHTAVIGGAIFATLSARQSAASTKIDTALVFIQPQETQRETPPPELQVPLKGFQTVAVPAIIPTAIPPVNLQEHFDPKDFSGVGVEGGTATGATPSANQVYSTGEVDQLPALVSSPPLDRDYPALLRQAGITGRVVVQAVIDTTGRAEPASIEVIQTVNPGFNDASKRWMARAVFRPARRSGHAVRVLVTQALDYSISR